MAGLEAADAVAGSDANIRPLTNAAVTSAVRRPVKRKTYRAMRTGMDSGASSRMGRPSR